MESSVKVFPYTIDFNQDMGPFPAWYKENESFIDKTLLAVGAINFKNVGITSLDHFDETISSIFGQTEQYLDANSPRAKYTSKVYNASEYDQDTLMLLHTEYSYANKWPRMLAFCCIQKPLEGGETTVGDSRKILSALSPELVSEFEEKGITYIRNMHGGQGLGPSWQDAFETTDKSVLEKHCEEYDIELEWKADGGVRLTQSRPAIRHHPVTNEKLWFNQVDQYAPFIYGEEIYDALLKMNGNDPRNLPMFATFGDGSPIKDEQILEIMKAFEKETVPVAWEEGDLLFVENMVAHHGRMPFKGPRRILVSMI